MQVEVTKQTRRRTGWLPSVVVVAALLGSSAAIAGVFNPNDFFVNQVPLQVTPNPIKPVNVADDTPIQPYQPYAYREADPTFASYGLEVGDMGPNVPLVTIEGNQVMLRETTSQSLPTLVVTVSLTCPIARNQLDDVERVAQEYSDRLDVQLVYVIEAHPVVDPSPYTGVEWPAAQNTREGIQYRQPVTMGERIALAEELIQRHAITLPMLVDGPSNSWWQTYGPAPNQAVLLATDGTVLLEHGWFDGDDLDIDADLTSLLAL